MLYHFEDVARTGLETGCERGLFAQTPSETDDRNPGMNQLKVKGVLLSE